MGCREDEFDSGKDSKDKVIEDGGRSFLDMINEKDGIFFNGCKQGDWDGEYTYVGARGCSVIDYSIVNESA